VWNGRQQGPGMAKGGMQRHLLAGAVGAIADNLENVGAVVVVAPLNVPRTGLVVEQLGERGHDPLVLACTHTQGRRDALQGRRDARVFACPHRRTMHAPETLPKIQMRCRHAPATAPLLQLRRSLVRKAAQTASGGQQGGSDTYVRAVVVKLHSVFVAHVPVGNAQGVCGRCVVFKV